MILLNDEAALTYAKEFTEIAMNNHMINMGTDSCETAKHVHDFYKTLVELFTADK